MNKPTKHMIPNPSEGKLKENWIKETRQIEEYEECKNMVREWGCTRKSDR